jgi:hypothetical protein
MEKKKGAQRILEDFKFLPVEPTGPDDEAYLGYTRIPSRK